MNPPDNGWPKLDWNRPFTRDGLQQRIVEIARLARRFETALEQGAEAGELELQLLTSDLEAWDLCASNVFMYTQLGEGRELEESEVPACAAQLAEVYEALIGLRRETLEHLGPRAAAPLAGEREVEIDERFLTEKDESKISRGSSADVLGNEVASGTAECEPPLEKPVTAIELRLRQAAEQKPLADLRLNALIASLPPDWVSAIHSHLALDEESASQEGEGGTRSGNQRQRIEKHLSDPESLLRTVSSLDEREKGVLSEILAADGVLPYSQTVARWGLDESDGFYWSQRPPSGPLGYLRRVGLVYVGTLQGKLVTVIPKDLAEPLESLIAISE